MQNHSPIKAFTLIEILIATAIAAGVTMGVLQMFIFLGRVNFDSLAKLGINRDVRSFSSELSTAARSTRDFRIYTSTTNLDERRSGQSGDVLVLIWADPESVDTATSGREQEFYYRRVIAFARISSRSGDNTGPVIRYEKRFPPQGSGSGTLKASETDIVAVTRQLLALTYPDADHREVIQLARGLSDERLFSYSRVGRSILVNGEIYNGNKAREVTSTYNFTITPRG
jgi:prepilin-type N-terminal cleavage/methylation domain-containing protein